MTPRRKIPLRLRRKVILRARSRCEYCRSPETFSLDSFTIDHILAVAASGSDDLDNLAFACRNCNNRKQDDRTAPDPQTQDRFLCTIPGRTDGATTFSGARMR